MGAENGRFWTPLDPILIEESDHCCPDYCGVREVLALPPSGSYGTNDYNVVIAGVVEIHQIQRPRVAKRETWRDGTRANGGGIEFQVPADGGCWHLAASAIML